MLHELNWHNYTLPNGRKAYLTCRPDLEGADESVAEFIEEKKPGYRFQYTDDWLKWLPKNGPPWLWFNWIPCGEPTLESIFASTCALYHINNDLPLEQSLWLHCDSSSMRAPTYFGLFLHAIYPDQVDEISETFESFPTNKRTWEYKRHSMPNKYAGYTLKSDDYRGVRVKDHIEAWQFGGETAAYKHYMQIPNRIEDKK